jgi:50S ribosomal subunit-associated GTPase HflX
LFESIKPLFSNKPLVIVLNKVDVIRPEDLDSDDRGLLENLASQENVSMIPMSNLSEEGVMRVKEQVIHTCTHTHTHTLSLSLSLSLCLSVCVICSSELLT